MFRFFKIDICLTSELFLITSVVVRGRSGLSFSVILSAVTNIFPSSKGLRS